MKFYLLEDDTGEVQACELDYATARAAVPRLAPYGYTIRMVDAPVCAETVRRLLGNLGGYARESRVVYPPRGHA